MPAANSTAEAPRESSLRQSLHRAESSGGSEALRWQNIPWERTMSLPDLNDPQIRALPIRTLALVCAVMALGGHGPRQGPPESVPESNSAVD